MSVSINGTGGLTFSDSSVQSTAATGFGFKNRIINGAMTIAQRGTGVVTPTTSADGFPVDRFNVGVSQNSKLTTQQTPSATETGYATRVAAGFRNYVAVTSSSAYSIGSSDYFCFRQFIEGYNIADFAWGTLNAATVTLSFWVNSSLTGTFGGSLRNSDGSRSYPFTYTINSANTWEQKTITIAGDTSGTWQTTNSTGVIVQWGLGVGSTYSGTAGSWQAANLLSATGATSVVGTSGATFYITGVQLEKGSTATSFDYRPYGTELALCQRYAYFVGAFMATHYTPSSSVYAGIPFTMRATPSVTMLGTLQMNNMIGNNLNLNGANFERGNQGGASIYLSYTGSSGASSAQACVVRPSSPDAYSGVLFTAEL